MSDNIIDIPEDAQPPAGTDPMEDADQDIPQVTEVI